jgi:S-DNA-T family DNA segregation ATPase FtsK/SpoIIIE
MGAARHLPVHPPGRALVRTGDGTITLVQTASLDRLDPEHLDGLVIRPFVVARERSAMEHRIERAAAQADRSGASTPLGPIVAAMTTAAATLAVQPHRPPVVDRLPERLPLRAFFDAAPGDGVPYGLADLPDAQRREIAWWRPGVDGHLLVYGAAGTGATSLLTTLALGIAERYAPDDVHLYLLDADPAPDTARLAALAALPHCGGHVHVGEIRRVAALLAVLDGELDRRAVSPPDPSDAVVVLMVDDLAALRRAAGTRRDLDGMWPRIERILHEGAALGVVAVLTTSDARAVGGTAAVVPTRLVMRLDDAGRSTADQRADADLGVDPGRVAGFGRGRALRLGDDTEVQLVRPPDDVATAISALGLEPARDRPPRAIDEIVARDGEG